ncbi:MAG: hypothetical protein P8M62_05890 [Opitutae bacterium]|jgi:hypothetical protein|nr:hypothetical protein [Opitutae bacterium]
MKTTDPRDPLDRKIDDLLTNRPVQASAQFTAQVLAVTEREDSFQLSQTHAKPDGQFLKFALPIAAVIAVAFTLAHFSTSTPNASDAADQLAINASSQNLVVTPAAETELEILLSPDIQEILMLTEGLAGLSQVEGDIINATDLLNTLNALTFEIES